jgi:hypothetical protein
MTNAPISWYGWELYESHYDGIWRLMEPNKGVFCHGDYDYCRNVLRGEQNKVWYPDHKPITLNGWVLRPRADNDGWTLVNPRGLMECGGSYRMCLERLHEEQRKLERKVKSIIPTDEEWNDPELNKLCHKWDNVVQQDNSFFKSLLFCTIEYNRAIKDRLAAAEKENKRLLNFLGKIKGIILDVSKKQPDEDREAFENFFKK